MSEQHFKDLIKRYAGDKQICNCGEAYYTNCGKGSVPDGNGGWHEKDDLPVCRHGCSANRIDAKYFIAEKVIEDLGMQECECCPACIGVPCDAVKEGRECESICSCDPEEELRDYYPLL